MRRAYSQVTKLARAGAAVAMAPAVDGLLLMVQCRLGLQSRQQAFWLLISTLLLITAAVFGSVMVYYA